LFSFVTAVRFQFGSACTTHHTTPFTARTPRSPFTVCTFTFCLAPAYVPRMPHHARFWFAIPGSYRAVCYGLRARSTLRTLPSGSAVHARFRAAFIVRGTRVAGSFARSWIHCWFAHGTARLVRAFGCDALFFSFAFQVPQRFARFETVPLLRILCAHTPHWVHTTITRLFHACGWFALVCGSPRFAG